MKSTALLPFVLLLIFPGLVAADTAATNTSTDGALLDIDLKDISVRDAVAKLFVGRTEGYFLAPGAAGKIAELKLKGITLAQGLKAIAEAAGLTYRTEDGIYVIEPAMPVAVQMASASTTSVIMAPPTSGYTPEVAAPPAAPQFQQAAPQPQATTQIVINSQPAPAYYGNPAPDPYAGYYGYPPAYQIGSVEVLPGGFGGGPVLVAGTGPQFIGRQVMPPPPPGWVTPDVLRFLRFQYVVPTRPHAGPGYYW